MFAVFLFPIFAYAGSPVAKNEATPQEVIIEAQAAYGWEFENWTGDVADPDSPTTTVFMDGTSSKTTEPAAILLQ